MDERREKQLIQQAFETSLSGLKDDPWLARRVIAQARETERTPVKVKRKLSVGLIVMIALMLVTVTAVAVALTWQQYAPTVKQMEYEQGSYATWPVADRVNLVHALIEMGHLDKSEDTEKLFAEGTSEKEKQAIADRLLLDLTGQTDIREINLDIITYAVLGYSDFWTPEQRVWWDKITYMFIPEERRNDPDRLVLPDDSAVSEAEAVEIARAAIIEAFELADNALDDFHPVADQYVTTQRPDYRRWNVTFYRYKEGTEHYIEKEYWAIVDEDGNVVGDPDLNISDVKEYAAKVKADNEKPVADEVKIYLEYCTQAKDAPFWEWPYELKADYSIRVRPMVINKEPLDREVALTTTYAYGIPAGNEMQYDKAVALAEKTIMDQYGLDEGTASAYNRRFEFYDTTDEKKPLWKFTMINPAEYYETWYRVEIDAITGEIVRAEKGHWIEHNWKDYTENYYWYY